MWAEPKIKTQECQRRRRKHFLGELLFVLDVEHL